MGDGAGGSVKRDETWWLVVGVLGLLWLESRKKPGGDSFYTPMPDWHAPEFAPKEIEIKTPKKTPATFDQMVSAFMEGYRDVTGDAPSMRTLALLLSVSAQETDEWRAMWEHNAINLTTTGKRGFFRLPGAGDLKFAPYPDDRTGASAAVAAFARKFPKSLGLMLTSSPEAVAAMMKQEGFYPTRPGETAAQTTDAYAKRMRHFFDKFSAGLPGPVT